VSETKSSSGKLSFLVLCALGAAMLSTNRWFTAVDDEVSIIDRASVPVTTTVRIFLSGAGQHEHPPLYDILLHGWLRLTSGNIHLLRVPATLFYLIGIWVIVRIAGGIAGRKAEVAALVLGALSPYGFHFGRVAAWYSFCFLLVALETYLYLRYAARRSSANWGWLFLCSLALIYSNYFGWALLALLALDFVLSNRAAGFRVFAPILGMGALLFAAFLPILLAFVTELHKGVQPYHRPLTTILTAAYVLYSMLVSESVAPWFWALGVPAAIAVAAVIALAAIYAPAVGRRLLAYFFVALAVMALIGVAETKRVMMLLPWLLLPIALAAASVSSRAARRTFACSLIVVFAIGWFGIFDRRLYAAPHWIEPWSTVAQQAADVVRDGGIVIGNNESFFFYLTYLLPAETPAASHGFRGFLPNSVSHRGVYEPEQWIGAGISSPHPVAPKMMLVKGLHFGTTSASTDETQRWLDQNCHITGDQLMVHDFGAAIKLRFGPADNQAPWRIELRSYSCP
jgi:uncharacterized membrane protein